MPFDSLSVVVFGMYLSAIALRLPCFVSLRAPLVPLLTVLGSTLTISCGLKTKFLCTLLPVSEAELTTDGDANVPQMELERVTAVDKTMGMKAKLDVSHSLFLSSWLASIPLLSPMLANLKAGF